MPTAPIIEIIIRGTVMYLVIYMLMRVAGKREPGGHSLTDLLVIVLVAEAAAPGIYGEASAVADSAVLIATILFWSCHRCDFVPRTLSSQTAEIKPFPAYPGRQD